MNFERDILSNYFRILENEGIAKYIQSKYSPVDFNSTESYNELWKKHDEGLLDISLKEKKPSRSLLNLKIVIADKIYRDCHFCEHQCRINRENTAGRCGVKKTLIASEFLHLGEEIILVPSYTIFFSGCTFNCVFCQNWDISQNIDGKYLEPDFVADLIKKRVNMGARNVNWVGGDPTSNLNYILKILGNCEFNIPQIWNSNMYCSIETMKLLNNIIDVYLTDFKYGNNNCAKKYSKVDNYFDIVKRNHKIACEDGEMIIRHLVMPGHIDCCSIPILDWISKNIPNCIVNIMSQYRPEYQANRYKEINRPVSIDEINKVKKYAKKLGLFLV